MIKKKLVFVTNNPHKLAEVSEILKDKIEILSLKDIQCNEDIPETSDTIEGNALQKAAFIRKNYGMDCFADDTGLEVEALNGEPGVYSARYAGENKNAGDNVKKLLDNLKDETNRKARFKTVIALILDNRTYLFEGIVQGEIIREETGNSGFGYDPVFKPEGFGQTFAEMGPEIKNRISHRALAVNKLYEFIKTI